MSQPSQSASESEQNADKGTGGSFAREEGNRDNAEQEFRCKYCNKTFPKSQALGGHMNGHRKDKEMDAIRKAWEIVQREEAKDLRIRQALEQPRYAVPIANPIGVLDMGVEMKPNSNTSIANPPHPHVVMNPNIPLLPHPCMDQDQSPWNPLNFSQEVNNPYLNNNSINNLANSEIILTPSHNMENLFLHDNDFHNLNLGDYMMGNDNSWQQTVPNPLQQAEPKKQDSELSSFAGTNLEEVANVSYLDPSRIIM